MMNLQQVHNKLPDCENREGTVAVQSTSKGIYAFEFWFGFVVMVSPELSICYCNY